VDFGQFLICRNNFSELFQFVPPVMSQTKFLASYGTTCKITDVYSEFMFVYTSDEITGSGLNGNRHYQNSVCS
jgi:hypothetical protein